MIKIHSLFFDASFIGYLQHDPFSLKYFLLKLPKIPAHFIKTEYLKALGSVSPKDVIVTIEQGWEKGKIPMNESILREYLKAVGALNKFDHVNIAAIMSRFSDDTGVGGGLKRGGGSGGGESSNSGMSSRFSAGSSPSDPLYIHGAVANQEPSAKQQFWKLVRGGLGIFLILSFLGSQLDEKGGAGGIGARLGMSSAVHQAGALTHTDVFTHMHIIYI
jgi:hypothetical protein